MIRLTYEEFSKLNVAMRRSCIYQQVAGDGTAGGSNFYTTEDAIIQSGGSAERLNNGLQKWEHPLYGPRNQLAILQVIAHMPMATSSALNNPQVNEGAAFGGYTHLYIKPEDITKGTQLVGFITLSK